VAEVAEVAQKPIFSYTKEINNKNIEKPATIATKAASMEYRRGA